MGFLLVFIGAGLGGMARHAIGLASVRLGPSFPYGTLAINVAGSVAMGLFAGWFAQRGAHPGWRLFVAVGILGGFTTFSSYSLDAVVLMERGETLAALLYVVGSVALGIGGLFAGLLAMRALL